MFVLEAGVYRASDSWEAVQPADRPEIVGALGRVIGMQVEEALRDVNRSELRANMVVTTMLDMPFTSGWMRWRDLQRSIRAHTESCPETLLSAYECASWGFALRYARSLDRPGHRLPGGDRRPRGAAGRSGGLPRVLARSSAAVCGPRSISTARIATDWPGTRSTRCTLCS